MSLLALSQAALESGGWGSIDQQEAWVSMINNRRTRRRAAWFTLAMTGLLLQACSEAPKPEAAKAGPRLYAADVYGGAKMCMVPKLSLTDGKPTDASMTVGNDGGWCGITVAQAGDKPYAAGLLTQVPQHGKVLIHQVGDATRVDYTPDANFTGSDSFSVTLIPSDPVIRTAVTVLPKK
jgi:hypothetical protein